MEAKESKIVQFYKNRTIFVTGATGFIGRAILQKLLQSCPLVGKIYVFIRLKKGENVNVKFQNLREDNVFEGIRNSNPELLEKLTPICGDVTSTQLGISDENWKLLCDEVSVVIHAAATVKFNERLRVALKINVRGTQNVIHFCKALKKIRAFVHVSSAFADCDKKDVQEVIYPLPMFVQELLEKIDSMSDKELEKMTQVLTYGLPNTYTYTKEIAENIVREEAGLLPISIVRPSIATGAWKEPYPGWVFGLNGPTGLLAAWGKGVLRTFFADKSKVMDIIPVDFCVNMILVAAYLADRNGIHGVIVFNCCSGTLNPITYGQFQKIENQILAVSPSKTAVRAPYCSFTTNRTVHTIHGYFMQALPALLADAANRLQCKKTRILKFYKILTAASKAMEFFATHDWHFATEHMATAYKELSEVDKKIFYFDVKEINWEKYLGDYWAGIQRYILKEI